MKAEIREIMKLARLKPEQKAKAEDYNANLAMNFKNSKEGIFKIKQIMIKYKLSFQAAYDCALDPAQLKILRTMHEKAA